jgi:hypothetical protein
MSVDALVVGSLLAHAVDDVHACTVELDAELLLGVDGEHAREGVRVLEVWRLTLSSGGKETHLGCHTRSRRRSRR